MSHELPVTMFTEAVSADPEAVASFLHRLANRIEAAEGAEVLIGLWSTGFGDPDEACFQVVLDAPNGSPKGAE
jgi:hypothetical protein